MRIVAILFAVLSMPAWSFSECVSSHVDIGRDYGASVYVNIKRSAFSLSNIACLARKLRTNRQDRASFSVLFFTSHEAAQNFLPTPLEIQHSLWARWASELHTVYYWNADNHEEYLEVYPEDSKDHPPTTPKLIFEVLLSTTVVCRLSVAARSF